MRIVIDLQGAQSPGSRNRGIGRYTMSLAQGIIRNKGEHEVIIVLNGLFSNTIEPIRAAFEKLLPQDNIRVWLAPGPVSHLDPANNWRRKTAELIREAFLASLQPDIVYITSLFEGLADDAVTSIGKLTPIFPTAVTLYDLIPFIYRKPYLDNPVVEAWYENKLDQVRRASLLLAISESSRQEGIKYLGFPHDRAVNVGTATDPQFKRGEVNNATECSIRMRYGLTQQFLMYTGGIDHRKNIEGLIRAYALLSKSLRNNHQLAIVCSVQPESRRLLEELAKQQGLAAGEVILTGFVPEEDLIALYYLCKAFVFPSWHEGFGLPALEAMSCGAPVISANTSSLPEVIGRKDALFDPHDDEAIAKKLTQVLTDSAYRAELIHHGLEQAKSFTWDKSAKLTITAFEQLYATSLKLQQSISLHAHRPKLAYISPLPPERSGIADYSAELLPELARYYDIDVIVAQKVITDPWIKENCAVRDVEWFVNHAQLYKRVLYHFGNSHYHQHMFDLLTLVPGVVVLHDFFLSGITAYMANQKWERGIIGTWEVDLYHNHGYGALIDFLAHREVHTAVHRYPCNKTVLEKAQGVIVHSEYSRRLAEQWLGKTFAKSWSVIPLLRVPVVAEERTAARLALGINDAAFIVCSFGFLDPTKQNQRLLDAWVTSALSRDNRCLLFFVGENHGGDYGAQLTATIFQSGLSDRIRITGWTDTAQFRQYLAAADLGVQLRTLSRGETSAAVLDCMNYGLPTIVNANGSMADLPNDCVWMLPDEFNDADLKKAIETLWKDEGKRSALSEHARGIIQSVHAPRTCADQYAQVIENYFIQTQHGKDGLVRAISQIEEPAGDEYGWLALAQAIASNQKAPAAKQLLLDITGVVQIYSNSADPHMVRGILEELLTNPPAGFRTEPVYANALGGGYRYARQFTLRFFDCPDHFLSDDPIEVANGDIFCGLDLKSNILKEQTRFYQHLRHIGVQVNFVWNLAPVLMMDTDSHGLSEHLALQSALEQVDGVVCISRVLMEELIGWLNVFGPKRLRPLKLCSIDEAEYSANKKGTATGGGNELTVVGEIPMRKTLTQKETTKYLLNIVLGDQWQKQWMPDEVRRFWGSDSRLKTRVGKRIGRNMNSEGQAGHLLFGPYIALAAGQYRVIIRGTLGEKGLAGARMDVAVEKGTVILGEFPLSEPDDSGCLVELPISLNISCIDLEVRVWISDDTDLQISMLQIEPWQFDGIHRLLGSDSRFGTQVGVRKGRDMLSTSQAGFLFFGPYISLAAGQYQVIIRGSMDENGADGAHMDVVVDKGNYILGKSTLSEPDDEGCLATLNISLDAPCANLEIRVWVSDSTDLRVSMIEIATLQGKEKAITADSKDTAKGDFLDEDAALIEPTGQQHSAQVQSFTPSAKEPTQHVAEAEAKVLKQDLTASSALVHPAHRMSSDKFAVIADDFDAVPTLQSAEVEILFSHALVSKEVDAKVAQQKFTNSSTPVQPEFGGSFDNVAVVGGDADTLPALRLAQGKMVTDHAQSSNGASAPGFIAIPLAVQKNWKASSIERNRAKAERKKKR